jgi:hypothetical protein
MSSHLNHGENRTLIHRKPDSLFEPGYTLQSKAGTEDGSMDPAAES